MSLLVHAMMLVFLFLIAYQGFILSYKTRVRMFHGIPFSYTWVTLSLPVAAVLMSTTVINKMRGFYREFVSLGGAAPGGGAQVKSGGAS
jgi:TRAP-type C4-dicarboxylate transport system permease small subunit